MGDIIRKELDWHDDEQRGYTKHFDCIAEPLTNYLRQKIYGYERRKCQYSNMIRRGEITRHEALQPYEADHTDEKPINYMQVLQHLDLTDDDINKALAYKPLKYEHRTSKINKIYAFLMSKMTAMF